MLYTLRFFLLKCSLFHNANLFGSVLFTFYIQGVLKLKKNDSGAKGLKMEAALPSETLVTAQCYNPGNLNLRIVLITCYVTSGTGALQRRGNRGVGSGENYMMRDLTLIVLMWRIG